MKSVEVVAAIIIKEEKILCTQKSEEDEYLPLKWEFPGGKVEKGETKEEALKREIKEELDMDIDVNHFFMTVDHKYNKFRVIMHAYMCEMNEEVFTLKEHTNFQWLSPNKLDILDWAEADLPIVRKIIEKY